MSMASALRVSIVICVVWACLLSAVESSRDPIYLWPFSNSTLTYEVMSGKDVSRRECPQLEAGHPDFDDGSFVFNWRGSGVEVKMDGRDMQTITFAFFVYPYDGDGVILGYQAEGYSNENKIRSMTVKLDNWAVEMTTRDEYGRTVSSIKSSNPIQAKTWTLIVVGKDDPIFYLQLNDSVQTGWHPGFIFDANGELNIARDSDRQTIYKGRLFCLSVWDTRVQSLSDIKKWCRPTEWRQKNPNQTCPATVPPVNAKLTHLWPLSLSSGGYNVVNGLKLATPITFQCLFTNRSTYRVPEGHIYLDGSAFSYLEEVMTTIPVSNDVTVAIAIKPDYFMEGVIWDIQIPAYAVAYQAWVLRLSLIDGFAVFEIRNASDPNRSWRIRIGQPLDLQQFTVGYHGIASCLAVVDGAVDGSNMHSLVDENCKLLDTQNRSVESITQSSTAMENCTDKDGIKDRRFRMAARDMCPSIESNSSSSVGSLVQCSSKCLRLSDCRSFAFRTSSSTNNCQLYIFVTKSGLRAEDRCNYYSVARN